MAAPDAVAFGYGAAYVRDGSQPEPVACVDGLVFRLADITPRPVASLWDVLRAPEEERSATVALGRAAVRGERAEPLAPGDYRLDVPLRPLRRDVLCVGLNYAEHVREGAEVTGRSAAAPADPIYFTKAPHAVVGPYDAIDAHVGRTQRLDYEVELAVVIGRAGHDIPRASALEHVFGYAVFNDVSARDLQAARKQWYLGKSLDDTSPFGPWIVPAEVVSDPTDLQLELSVNGELRQRTTTGQMLVDVPSLIHDLSQGHTLAAGDIIATGTPSGCGFAMTPPRFLVPGDVVEASVAGLGWQRNLVR